MPSGGFSVAFLSSAACGWLQETWAEWKIKPSSFSYDSWKNWHAEKCIKSYRLEDPRTSFRASLLPVRTWRVPDSGKFRSHRIVSRREASTLQIEWCGSTDSLTKSDSCVLLIVDTHQFREPKANPPDLILRFKYNLSGPLRFKIHQFETKIQKIKPPIRRYFRNPYSKFTLLGRDERTLW